MAIDIKNIITFIIATVAGVLLFQLSIAKPIALAYIFAVMGIKVRKQLADCRTFSVKDQF